MSLPYFFVEDLTGNDVDLPKDTAKHCMQVLRMKAGEKMLLTNGKGHLIVHTFQKNTVLVLKGEMIGFVQEKRFEWMGNPRPELIPFIEEAFSSRKKAS